MPFEASGQGGDILYRYQRAADLAEWEIRRREEVLGDPVTVLTGRLVHVNRFWIGHSSAVTVRLQLSGCRWVWDVAELQSIDPLYILLYDNPRALLKER